MQIVDYIFDFVGQSKIFFKSFYDTLLTPNSYFSARKSLFSLTSL